MILEGYNVQECDCYQGNFLEFQEVQYFEEPRYMIICPTCGNASTGAKTKENAVHIWNKNAKKMLLG